MAVVIFFIVQWYVSLFCQSFFHHRYAAHAQFTMTPFWEKYFFILSFLSQGSSYISAHTYGIMHRHHHAYTDTVKDPHTPMTSSNVFKMMWDTKNRYNDYFFNRVDVNPNEEVNLPEWKKFDKYAHNWVTRLLWVVIYIAFWTYFATEWWHWIFLPLSMAIGSLQGAMVNYFAHTIGYKNFELDNTSRNLYPFYDLFLWGESYHNNHHKYPGRINHAIKWFEWDPMYHSMRFLNFAGIIKMKIQPASLPK